MIEFFVVIFFLILVGLFSKKPTDQRGNQEKEIYISMFKFFLTL